MTQSRTYCLSYSRLETISLEPISNLMSCPIVIFSRTMSCPDVANSCHTCSHVGVAHFIPYQPQYVMYSCREVCWLERRVFYSCYRHKGIGRVMCFLQQTHHWMYSLEHSLLYLSTSSITFSQIYGVQYFLVIVFGNMDIQKFVNSLYTIYCNWIQ